MIYPLPEAMITQPKIFISQCIDIGGSLCPCTCMGMLQHAFYNGIGAFAMVIDFLFIFLYIICNSYCFIRFPAFNSCFHFFNKFRIQYQKNYSRNLKGFEFHGQCPR